MRLMFWGMVARKSGGDLPLAAADERLMSALAFAAALLVAYTDVTMEDLKAAAEIASQIEE